MSEIAIDLLRELVAYDPETGKLTWLARGPGHFEGTAKRTPEWLAKWWNTRYAGKEAFQNVEAYGCKAGRILGKTVKAHRVAWAIAHGEWPCHTIDHINGDPADNRIANLRDVPIAQNARNKGLYSNNTSGHHGVAWYKPYGRWVSTIRVDGKKRHLGYFDDLDAAIAARRAAEGADFHENHGRAA